MRQMPALDPVDLADARVICFARVLESRSNWQPHFHEVDELVYAPHGMLVAQTGKQCCMLPSLRALWLPAGTAHEVTCSNGSEIVCLYISPGFVHLGQCLLEISPLLRQLILRVARWGSLREAEMAQAHLLEVVRDEIEAATAVRALVVPDDPRAHRVAVALTDAERVEDSLDAICRAAGASRRTIERLFRQDTGLSLGQWRTQVRLQRSLEMLSRGEKMTFTATEVGYSTPSAFIASFKRFLGTTPGQYLRERL